MIDVIDDLGKVRMGGVIDISQVNKPRLVHSHASVVNAVNDLNPFELFDQVEHVVPVNQEPLLLVVLHDFRVFLVQLDVPSEPLCEVVSFLIIDYFFFVVLVEVRSVKHDFLELYSLI